MRQVLIGKYETLEALEELQQLVPHHQVRLEEQLMLQQYSTPLALAYIVKKLAADGYSFGARSFSLQPRSSHNYLKPFLRDGDETS